MRFDRPFRSVPLLALLALPAAAQEPAGAVSAPAPSPSPSESVLAAHAPAVVPVRVSLSTEMRLGGEGETSETTLDALGVLVDPGGLVMMWGPQISSGRLLDIARQMNALPEGFEMDITPTDFRVLLPGGTEPRRAFLVASDGVLDLAYLQVEEAPAAPLPVVDFSRAAPPAVGLEVYAVTRLGRAFDFAPLVEVGRLGGRLEKPRRAFIPTGDLSGVGLPLFDAAGLPVGVLSTVLSSLDDQASADTGIAQMLGSMARRSSATGPLGVFMLEAAQVAESIERARRRAGEMRAEAEANPPAPRP